MSRSPGGAIRISDRDIIEALYKCLGNKTAAAKQLNTNRNNIANRMKRNPKIVEAIDEMLTYRLELLSDKLFEMAMKGDRKSIINYLDRYDKMLAKIRGESTITITQKIVSRNDGEEIEE